MALTPSLELNGSRNFAIGKKSFLMARPLAPPLFNGIAIKKNTLFGCFPNLQSLSKTVMRSSGKPTYGCLDLGRWEITPFGDVCNSGKECPLS